MHSTNIVYFLTLFIVVSVTNKSCQKLIFPVAALSLAALLQTFPFSSVIQRFCFSNESCLNASSMDNNSNNSSYSFHNPLICDYIEPDPALVYRPNDPQQRNVPVVVEQGNHLTNGGGVPNLENGGWLSRKRKIPFVDPMIEDHPMHGNNNFLSGVNMSAHINLNELRFWSPGPKPMFCTCCQVLRQLIYTNGSDCERFEIHGEIGVISHAIVHCQNFTPDGLSCDAYRKIDFCHSSTAEIKSYLVEYCAQKNKLGYIALEDPLSTYYEALCTGLETVGVFIDEDENTIPQNDGEEEPEPEPEPESGPENKRASACKPNRQFQIKRIKTMTLNDLRGVFHLTIKDAAAEIGISVSGIKTICRRERISYWPQRKVTSLAKRVQVLKKRLDSPDPVVRKTTREDIQCFQQLITGSCGGVTPTGIELLQFQQ